VKSKTSESPRPGGAQLAKAPSSTRTRAVAPPSTPHHPPHTRRPARVRRPITAMPATSGRERSNSKSSPLRKVLSLHQNPRKQQQQQQQQQQQEDEEAQLLHGIPPQRGEKGEPLTETCVWAYAVGHVLNDASAACWFSYLLVYLVRFGLGGRLYVWRVCGWLYM